MSDTPNNGHCQQNLRRVVISSLIGAVIEWYDFFLYGVVAGIVFNKIYFPDFDPWDGRHGPGLRHLCRGFRGPSAWGYRLRPLR